MKPASILSTFATALCLMATGLLSTSAQAQTGLTLPPYTPIVAVSPLVAPVGTERTITISGSWPDGCVPTNPSIVNAAPLSTGINVRFVVPQTLVACTAAITPYSGTVTYTPTAAGVQKITISLNDGRVLGESSLVTRAADGTHSQWDLTGAWSEANSNGSGLALFHSHTGSDALAGTWHVYDTAGKPYWYLIQNGRWDSATVFTGALVQTSSAAGTCPLGLPACQRAMTGSQTAATIRIEILALDSIRVTIASAGPPLPDLIIGSQFVATRLRF